MRTNIRAIFELKETIKMAEVGYFAFVMMEMQSLNISKCKKLIKWPEIIHSVETDLNGFQIN